jgi:hypothetical protein
MLRLVATVLVWLATCEAVVAACPPDQYEINGRCVTLPRPSHLPQQHHHTQPAPPPAPLPGGQRYSPAPAAHVGGQVFHQLVPVRSYLRATDIAPKNVAAYGVVAFRAKPTPATRDRLRMACISYTKTLVRQVDLPSAVSPKDQMLTIWPLDDPANKQAAADNCDFVIDHYELYGGDSAIQDALRQGAILGDSGPFLIGWSPSNTRGIPDKLVLTVDMSGLDSQQSFDQAFLFWKKKVVEDPTLWRSGFHSEELKLSIRDFVDHYGEAVLAAVKLWKKE